MLEGPHLSLWLQGLGLLCSEGKRNKDDQPFSHI